VNKNFDPQSQRPPSPAASPPTTGDEDTVVMRSSPVYARRDSTTAMLQSMFEGLSDGAVLVDMQGRFVLFNAAAQTILGMGPTAGPAQNWPREYGLFLPDGVTPYPHEELPLFRALSGHRSDGVEVLARNRHLPAGKWLRVCAAPVFDEQGRQIGAMAVFSDESARKKAELALESERRFLRHLITTQDRDRRLTAYDLHDGVVQMMTGALMRMEAATARRTEPTVDNDHLSAAKSLVREALDEARRLIGGMRPPVLDEKGLLGAVEFLVDHHRRTDGTTIEFVHDAEFPRLSSVQESTLFRIIQEALHNAARHSGTDRVRLELRRTGEQVRVEVRDWGCGFDMTRTRLRRYGLRGIEERAQLLGGSAEITSTPGQGTNVCVQLPLIHALQDENGTTEL